MRGALIWPRTVAVLACLGCGAGVGRAESIPHLVRWIFAQGSLTALKLPVGWVCIPGSVPATDSLCSRGAHPKRSLVTVAARQESPDLVLASFHRIPNSITTGSLEPGLLGDEIRSLSGILGKRGDNQYVNVIPYPNRKAPTYHLDKIQFMVIADRLMIETEGTFMDAAGHVVSFDQSVSSESADAAHNIDEIALTTPEPTDRDLQRRFFEAILPTIEWRPRGATP